MLRIRPSLTTAKSADRLSKVGAPQSITYQVMDFDFGDPDQPHRGLPVNFGFPEILLADRPKSVH
jgi:hypothetical protein